MISLWLAGLCDHTPAFGTTLRDQLLQTKGVCCLHLGFGSVRSSLAAVANRAYEIGMFPLWLMNANYTGCNILTRIKHASSFQNILLQMFHMRMSKWFIWTMIRLSLKDKLKVVVAYGWLHNVLFQPAISG